MKPILLLLSLWVPLLTSYAGSRQTAFIPVFENGERTPITQQDYGNIELRLELRTEIPNETGIRVRGNGTIKLPTNRIKLNKWNALRLIQVGNRQWIWLNKKLVTNGLTSYPFSNTELPLPQSGKLCFDTHNGNINWRKVAVRKIEIEESIEYLRATEKTLGFTPIFNGKNLDNWKGQKNGKTVSNGILHWNDGGNLFTNKKYSNFVFRFEFTLSHDANNGLAIRSKANGNPAYDAMTELQILDNSAERYDKLNARQYHGSAYGMAAALRGYQNPVGAWNYQEVKVNGTNIRVELNGTIILDVDLSTVTDYMDDKEHPGKLIQKGFLGFAGHGKHMLQFRNLTLLEL